eukprot:TRINITY_DN57518_c0_g1_i1.p1 TRINITY_DN57518_c0_g1~~TRINITY_DN57518_c0_g1_i1.p1  ORF type:complete len:443 (+),score=23.79 TRINITY_DN57518_c0_g1_i1:43-1371(+)
MGDSAYTPSNFVKDVHFNIWRGPGPRDFDPHDTSYWIGVTWTPTILAICGTICVFLWNCIKCCCGKKDKKKNKQGEYHLCLRLASPIFGVLLIGAAAFGCWQNAESHHALLEMETGLQGLITTFNSLDANVTTLSTNLGALNDTLTASAEHARNTPLCGEPAAIAIETVATQISSAYAEAESVQQTIAPIASPLNSAEDGIHHGIKWRNIVTLIVLVLAASIALITICGLVFSCDRIACTAHSIKIMTLIATVAASLMIGAGGVQLLISILGADFCMSPSDNIADKVIPQGQTDIRSIVLYYISPCGTTEEPEFRKDLKVARLALVTAGTALNAARTAFPLCFTNGNQMDQQLKVIQTSLDNILADTTCEAVYPDYNQAVQKGFCSDLLPPLLQLTVACGLGGAFSTALSAITKHVLATKAWRRGREYEHLTATSQASYDTY